MHNEKVVSEREIINTIENMEECVDVIKDCSNNLNNLVDDFKDIMDDFKGSLKTVSGTELLNKMNDTVNLLESKQKSFSSDLNKFLLNIEYTQGIDETVKGVIDG